MPTRAWQRLSAGPGAKGHRWYDWAFIDVADPAVSEGEGPHWLLIRRRVSDGEYAFYRAHAPSPVPLARLVRVAGSRWKIEDGFAAGKELAGLDEHQVRSWTSWHRWTVLALLACAFLSVLTAAQPHGSGPGDGRLIPLTRSETRLPHGLHQANVPAMTDPGPRSGLIVEIPEAEPAVARHRERLDANARLGIPAHITVLFPFMPPRAIGPAALTGLEHLFAAVSQFRFQIDRTAWFGDEVLWLAPRDPGPFRALTRAVVEAFPAFPPYEGQFGDSTPHLTVGHGHPLTSLRAAEESVRPHLPIDAQATAVTLMTQQSTGGQWSKAATFTLS